MGTLSNDAIRQQSLGAINQWGPQWRKQAKEHSRFPMKNLDDFQNSGVGKACLLVANGYSLEQEIETIKANKDNVDIFACDKSLGHLIKNGIKPKFVIICDANVNYEKYMKPYEDELKDTILFCNVCANPEWTRGEKWKDIYFFVNEDVLKSEVEFSEISGCSNLVPAATNVSNAMVVFLTQSNNKCRNNFFGYDKLLLIGFDYSWREDGNYYAFDEKGGGKRNYMKHLDLVTFDGKYVSTSNNLLFSAKWLDQYVRAFSLPVVQCGKGVVFSSVLQGSLDKQMKYSHRPEDKNKIKSMMIEVKKLNKKLSELNRNINNIGRDHYKAMMASI